MADGETIALLNHIKDVGERVEEKLDDHIERDEKVTKEFVLPMWNDYQRRQGVTQEKTVLKKSAGFFVNAGIALIGAWAMVKALK